MIKTSFSVSPRRRPNSVVFCPSREQTALTHGLPRTFTSPSSHTEDAGQICGRNAAHSGYLVGFQVDAPLGFHLSPLHLPVRRPAAFERSAFGAMA